ncbi:MAG: S8 family peptidase [Planctomycetota bacterium]
MLRHWSNKVDGSVQRMNMGHQGVGRLGVAALVMFAMTSGAPIALAATPLGEPSFEPDVFGGYASDRIIVRFKPAAMQAVAAVEGVPNRHRNEPNLGQGFHGECRAWGVNQVRPCFRRGFGNPGLASDLGLDRTFVLEVPPGTDALSMADAFSKMSEVESAGTVSIGGIASFLPNDPDFGDQWGMRNTGQTGGTSGADVDAIFAWDVHTGDEGSVTIAIIDSGVSLHNDYAAHVTGGINTALPGSTALSDMDSPICPHGTHVTGIAAAIGNNGIGVVGMTWGANILRIRALNGCSGGMDPVADGIIWATDNGADVINISLQFYNLNATETAAFEAAVDYAWQQGVLVVAAAGNCGSTGCFDVAHPAEFDNVMAVAATDDNDLNAGFSQQGPALSVAAPGEFIWSTYPSPANSYDFVSGTSMASPLVAGLGALLKSYLPGATNEELWELIESNVEDLGDPGHDIMYGWGRVNAANSMEAADAFPRVLASMPESDIIDARQPFDPGGSNPDGYDLATFTFHVDATDLVVGDFIVDEQPASGNPPAVMQLAGLVDTVRTVILDGPINPLAWTSIRHRITDTGVRIGFLPSDINSDGVANADDLAALIGGLDGEDQLAEWQSDLDRNGVLEPEDLLRAIDLLNGGGSYDAHFGVELPE